MRNIYFLITQNYSIKNQKNFKAYLFKIRNLLNIKNSMTTNILYTQNFSFNNSENKILNRTTTLLIKNLKSNLILKRDMQSSSRGNFSHTILRNNLNVVSKINSTAYLQQTHNKIQERGMVVVRAGKITSWKDLQKQAEEKAVKIQSDQSHFHKKIIAVVCPQEGCKTTNCVQGTEKTNPCGKSPQFHKQLFTDQKPSQFSNELMGSFTHKIPANKIGVFINHIDSNDTGHPQYLVTEKAVLYVDSQIFKENKKITSFCQQNYTTNNVIANAPLDSVTVINDPNTKIIKYTHLQKTLNNISTDDGF